MRLGYPAIVVSLLSGCFADGSVGVRAAVVAPAPVVIAPAPVVVEPAPPPEEQPVAVDEEAPDLVDVSPGVQVIYDYDEPIFFSDGFYWREENGIWFSSRSYRGGWGRYGGGVPMRFRGNFNVHAYAHYRPAGYTPRHGGVRVEGRGEVREGGRVEGRGEVREPGRGEPARVEGRGEGHGEVVHGEVHGEARGTVNAHPAAPAKAPAKAPPKKNTH